MRVRVVALIILPVGSYLIGLALHAVLPQNDATTELGRAVAGTAFLAIALVPVVALVEAVVRRLAHAKPLDKGRSVLMWTAYAWVVTAWFVLLMAS